MGAFLAVVSPEQAQAQSAIITGKVTSQFGQNVEGAQIYINDLNISVPTNAQGEYTINIPPSRASGQQVNLRVRALGYAPEVRPIRVTAGTQTIQLYVEAGTSTDWTRSSSRDRWKGLSAPRCRLPSRVVC